MATKIQVRRDSSADWTTINPTLGEGEIGFEVNTGKFKIGNGSSAWSALDYFDVEVDLSAYLTQASASTTYLTQASASTTYQAKVANVDDTEIGYLNNASANIQTQINSKASISSPTFSGTVTVPSSTTTTGLIVKAGAAPTASITAVSYSGSAVIFTANNTFTAGDSVRIQLNYSTPPNNTAQSQPYQFPTSAIIATANATQFTVTTANQGTVGPTFVGGTATRIIANALEIRDSSNALLSAIDQFGVLSGQTFNLTSNTNYTQRVTNDSFNDVIATLRLNNIFVNGKLNYFAINISNTGSEPFPSNGTMQIINSGNTIATSSYQSGFINKTANATALTSGGDAALQTSMPLPIFISGNNAAIIGTYSRIGIATVRSFVYDIQQSFGELRRVNARVPVGDGLQLNLTITGATGSPAPMTLNTNVITWTLG